MIELRWRPAEGDECGFLFQDQKYMPGGTTPMVLQYRDVLKAERGIVHTEWRNVPVEDE